MKNQTKINYNKEIMKRFVSPKNAGKIKNPDIVGIVGNINCGDVMHLYLKFFKNKKSEEKIIKDIKFQTLGCPAAIASSDVLCELVRGKTISEAINIKNTDIIKKLKNMPSIKIHCSVLGEDALTQALYNYFKKKNIKIPKKLFLKYKRIHQKEKH